MLLLVDRLYKKLPEVVAMKQVRKRDEDYSLNRLKARVFNRVSRSNSGSIYNLSKYYIQLFLT